MHQWWSPYEFALEYGRSWILVFDEDTEMKCSYEVLKDRLGTIEMMRVSGLSTSEILRLEQKCLEFKEKVNAYYLGRWDERLKESINANKWM